MENPTQTKGAKIQKIVALTSESAIRGMPTQIKAILSGAQMSGPWASKIERVAVRAALEVLGSRAGSDAVHDVIANALDGASDHVVDALLAASDPEIVTVSAAIQQRMMAVLGPMINARVAVTLGEEKVDNVDFISG